MAGINYTVNTEETEDSFDAIPAGEYVAIIEQSDYVANKKGTGMILKLTYQIVDESPMKGRKLFENLNLENQNKQAEQISRKALNAIGVATGVLNITDSSLLHNIPMIIDVKVKNDDTYGMSNSIKSHKPYGSTPVQAAPHVAGQAPGPAPSAKQPWQR